MRRRHYTPELANRSLPLVKRIAADIQQVAREVARKAHALQERRGERQRLQDEIEALRQRFGELLAELQELGVELKDPMTGLLDFRAMRDGQEVYLCWRLGEEAVDHWHSLEGGFAARQPIEASWVG
ncbi:MAG: DUF2203 domain-containing protein [Planctomycetota bacterium]